MINSVPISINSWLAGGAAASHKVMCGGIMCGHRLMPGAAKAEEDQAQR